MPGDFLIVDKRIVPDYFEKVVEARVLLESQKCSSVNEAIKKVGISKSTYYKYKDFIFLPDEQGKGHRFTISLKMDDSPGLLSEALQLVSAYRLSIVTIHQDVPINGAALVTMTLDGSQMKSDLNAFLKALLAIEGVNGVSLMAIE